ncbi:hypothetical protein Cch02nite_75750 [Catellatospora chokoriensis]|uniref:Collagenase n=2 Tax=Catellatospora chokoriensis TaxID=310353 RepID=A0A8J3JZU1_9ACTN|nr:hypothetical protein Cch02nite_75750 [Catellatospora chokoriensis]
MDELFPNTFTFDDGAMTVLTPLGLPALQVLYDATKRVHAQFSRVTQTIAPLPEDHNGQLTVFLFGSNQQYIDHAKELFDIDTDNGGIYIEPRGTFYTFDRVGQTYTLEELFRHEYAHYLAGRYLIGGMWANTPIYHTGRMQWFDEGFAEFLTGATATGGVTVRKTLVGRIKNDGVNRMTVADILRSTYESDAKYYRYSALLFNYWYANDPLTLLDIVELVRAGEPEAFLERIEGLAVDPGLESNYQAYLDGQIALQETLTNPSTPQSSPVLDLSDVNELENRIREHRFGTHVECSVAAVEVNTRFSARGCLTGVRRPTKDMLLAWRTFNKDLDELLADLQARPENNFDQAVGRFGRIHFNGDDGLGYYPLANFQIEGPLGPNGHELLPPLAQVVADFKGTRLGINASGTLLDDRTVQVNLALTTVARAAGTADAVFQDELTDDLFELRDDVYAIRPTYYRAFECGWDGDLQIIDVGVQQYGLRPISCVVSLE